MNIKALSYIYDFLSFVFEENALKEKIQAIILFGSIAKKSANKKSDIDLFFDIKKSYDIEFVNNSVKNALKSFEIKAEKTWNIKGIKIPISFIVGSLEENTWDSLRDEIASSGIILYGTYKEMPKNLIHYFLFYYTLRNLNRRDKMKFIRILFGYSLKKGKKEYKQEGLLKRINGRKLASNVILISSDEIIKVKDVFNKFRIKFRIIETWVRE